MGKEFTSYIASCALIGICAFISESVSTVSGQRGALERGMKLITSLCMFTAVLLPVFSMLGKVPSKDYESNVTSQAETVKSGEIFIEMIGEDLEKQLEYEILSKFGIQTEYIGIELTEKDNSIITESVSIGILKKDSGKAQGLEEHISALFDEGTEITVSELEK